MGGGVETCYNLSRAQSRRVVESRLDADDALTPIFETVQKKQPKPCRNNGKAWTVGCAEVYHVEWRLVQSVVW
jgi:hypothetical protein